MICDQCETVKHCTKYGCIPERIGKPKPAAQRQPSWVGLTDEEQTEIMSEERICFSWFNRSS
jgi:hypothetical protein